MQTNEYDIVEAFRKIEEELIASMIRNMKRHKAEEADMDMNWSMWQAEQLKALEKYKKENQKKYSKQFRSINAQIEKLIQICQEEGNMEQEKVILQAIKKGFSGAKKVSKGLAGEFFKLNERKLEALIKATTDDMKKAETAILRRANDQYRKVIFNTQVYANTGAGTYEKAVDMATKDMLSAGLQCVEYSNGAMHTLKDYARMAIRTASKRAYLQGEGQMRQEWGIATVIVNKRGNPCPKCLPFCGKVLIDDVWSGGSKEDGDYPLMSYAIECGLYHPNCKDAHTTYFPGISTMDDTWTEGELESIGLRAKTVAKQQHAKRQSEKYERLERYSLDSDNKKQYGAKARTWKTTSAMYKNERVEYNPESDYTVNVPGYSEQVNDGLSSAAKDLARRGTEDGFEHMHLVDLKTGKLEFYETNQEPGSVGDQFWEVIKKFPDKEFAFVHNHNVVSSLSEADLMTVITTSNIPLTVAVQNDGVIYYAKRKKMAPDSFWPDMYFEEELRALNADARSGKIMPSERARRREEIIIRCILEEFFEGMVVINGKAE